MSEPERFAGVDVSKAQLDLGLLAEGKVEGYAKDEAGVAAVVQRLVEWNPPLGVREASGGLEMLWAATGRVAGLPLAVVNARPVGAFAKATGRLAKTDSLDALILARFAPAVGPEIRPGRTEAEPGGVDLLIRRRQLVEMRAQEKTRLAMAGSRQKDSLKAHIAWLNERIAELDGEWQDQRRKSALCKTRVEVLQRAPGVGPVTWLPWLA